jgi:hypothetical protein
MTGGHDDSVPIADETAAAAAKAEKEASVVDRAAVGGARAPTTAPAATVR